jgi:hypothetical protein
MNFYDSTIVNLAAQNHIVYYCYLYAQNSVNLGEVQKQFRRLVIGNARTQSIKWLNNV